MIKSYKLSVLPSDIDKYKSRLLNKISVVNECWEWQASLNEHGYGQLAIYGKRQLAHRASWAIHKGEVPEDILVLHSCDNPPCVNPGHLFLGTAKDNSDDRDIKGRLPLRVDDLLERFWSRVEKTDNCWIWTGALNKFGYGRIAHKGDMLKAHRVSWIIHNSNIPDKMRVIHKCENRRCVNPSHLFIGTSKDAAKIRDDRGNLVTPFVKGCTPHNAKFIHSLIVDDRQSGMSLKDIRDKYSINRSYLWRILKNANAS